MDKICLQTAERRTCERAARGGARREIRSTPNIVKNFMTSSEFLRRGPSRKRNSTNRTVHSIILKPFWEWNTLYVPGFGDLQQYETWKCRICAVSGPLRILPDFAPKKILNRAPSFFDIAYIF